MALAVSGASTYVTAAARALLILFGPGGSLLTPGCRGSWESEHLRLAGGNRPGAAGRNPDVSLGSPAGKCYCSDGGGEEGAGGDQSETLRQGL